MALACGVQPPAKARLSLRRRVGVEQPRTRLPVNNYDLMLIEANSAQPAAPNAWRCSDPARAVATTSDLSEVPGQAQSSELGALPLGFERLGEVRLAEEEDETAMSHGDTECAHADEGLGAD
jgi:hypothetical protein